MAQCQRCAWDRTAGKQAVVICRARQGRRTQKRKNPTLSRLARKYLCVPGTSIQAERVFSWMECLLNKRRLSMSGESVPMQLFLQEL